MAISGADATALAARIKAHAGIVAGADDTATTAKWIRSRWGASGTDAQVIAAFASAKGDVDLVRWAQTIRASA